MGKKLMVAAVVAVAVCAVVSAAMVAYSGGAFAESKAVVSSASVVLVVPAKKLVLVGVKGGECKAPLLAVEREVVMFNHVPRCIGA